MLTLGKHPRVLQEQLDRATNSITMDLCPAVAPELQVQAAKEPDALLGTPKKEAGSG